MAQENDIYTTTNTQPKYPEVVSIPISLEKSLQGQYFVGQTKSLFVGNGSNAWAGLFNPCNSHSNLYVNVFTISNFSNEYLTAEIWLNTNPPGKGKISNKVSPANTALIPPPKNKVQIRYVESTNGLPQGGVNIYKRIVPPNTTLVSEEDGKFIIPPCGNYVVFLKSSSSKLNKAIVAFGWWEQPR